MKKESLICSKQDYDFYKIILPFNIFAKGSKDKFLYSELGKLHPCFSDDFVFDKKFCIKKKKLVACVMVISRYKLAEYKSKNYERGLCIQEMGQKKYFVPKKKKCFLLIIFALLVMCVAGIICLCIRKSAVKKELKQENTVSVKNDELELQNKNTVENFKEIESLFLFIKKNNGNIDSFSMKIDGFTGRFELKINDVFPETLLDSFPEIKISSVKYDEEKPVVSISFSKRLFVDAVDADLNISGENKMNNSIRKQIRNFIQKNQIDLISETVQPFMMKLILEKKDFPSLLDFLNENNVCISDFVISKNVSEVRVDMIFADDACFLQNTLFETLGNYCDLFKLPEVASYEQQKIPVISEEKVKVKTLANVSDKKNQTNANVLGTIIKNDGTVMEYFKNSEGKIEKRVKER